MNQEKRALTDKPLAIVLFIVGAVMLFMNTRFPETSHAVRLSDTDTIPNVCAILIMFFAVVLFIQASIKDKENKGNISGIIEQLKEDKFVYLLFGMTVLYIILFSRLGFVVSTFLYTWFTSFVLGKGKIKLWVITVIALGISVGAYLFFAILLEVRMPGGLLI